MRRVRLLPVLVVLALLVITAAPTSAQLSGQNVVIAVAGPLTGAASALGVEQKQGVEVAVEERNAAGGILGAPVVLVAPDDRADAAEGKAVAQRLCDDPPVPGVVGHVDRG